MKSARTRHHKRLVGARLKFSTTTTRQEQGPRRNLRSSGVIVCNIAQPLVGCKQGPAAFVQDVVIDLVILKHVSDVSIVIIQKAEAMGLKARTPILQRRPAGVNRETLLAQLDDLSSTELQSLLRRVIDGKQPA